MSPLKLVLKHRKFVEAFSSLGVEQVTPGLYSRLEEFVCHLYCCTQLTSAGDSILVQCEKKFKPKITGKLLSAVKSLDASEFIPCVPCVKSKSTVPGSWHACTKSELSFSMQ